jgi:hypothetical protein
MHDSSLTYFLINSLITTNYSFKRSHGENAPDSGSLCVQFKAHFRCLVRPFRLSARPPAEPAFGRQASTAAPGMSGM